jgi:hypothetical protein
MAKIVGVGVYDQIILHIFDRHHKKGEKGFFFDRDEIIDAAHRLNINLAKNPGDVVYSYRFRKSLPKTIVDAAPKGKEWIISLAGTGRYQFELVSDAWVTPSRDRLVIKVPNSTPAMISENQLSDEQAVLAILRYNRLIDTFLRATCYSLQNHLRTQIPDIGQIEIDELYLGVDRRGVQYVIPVQAKGGRDKLGIVQVRQDVAYCKHKFPHLVCRPVAAQFMKDDVVALLELVEEDRQLMVVNESHFRLVPAGEVSIQDLERYRTSMESS